MVDFAGFHIVNAGQHICVPGDRVNAVAFAGGDEGEVDGGGLGAPVRASEEAIFSHEDPV